MSLKTKITVTLGSILLIALILYLRKDYCKCKDRISYQNIDLNKEIDLNVLYTPTDSTELQSILLSWKNFSEESDTYQTVNKSGFFYNRNLLVVRHTVHGAKHYGAIVLPKDYDENKKYPLLVWANGLDQSNPTVDLRGLGKVFMRLKDYFILVPSYRGQALVANGRRYCSDGFFGDAFDGATDDALRLLALAKNEFKGIDSNRVVVSGTSRGGTVALLMGIRDPGINAVISIAAPTNFFSEEMYNRYTKQYKYQFLSHKKSIMEIRAKMIKSSPIYFVEKYPNALLLIHGENDKIVPVSHAHGVIAKLKQKENFEYRITDQGHAIDNQTRYIMDWLRQHN